MEQKHTQLLSVMEELIDHHRELVALEQEKIKLVIDQDWKLLEERVEQSRAVLQKIDDAEKRRVGIIGTLSGNINGGPQTLSEVSAHVPDTCVGELMRSGEMLRCSFQAASKSSISHSRSSPVQARMARPTAVTERKGPRGGSIPLSFLI